MQTPRRYNQAEPLPEWQARAVIAALASAGMSIVGGMALVEARDLTSNQGDRASG